MSCRAKNNEFSDSRGKHLLGARNLVDKTRSNFYLAENLAASILHSRERETSLKLHSQENDTFRESIWNEGEIKRERERVVWKWGLEKIHAR